MQDARPDATIWSLHIELPFLFRELKVTGDEILALIGGFATGSIGTGLITSALYDGLKNAYTLLPITDSRKKALSRSWNGSFIQGDKKYLITLNLKVKNRKITGDGEYTDGKVKVEIVVNGGLYRDDHLHLSYRNKNKAIFQHGLFILQVPNNPTQLTGKFVGIGRDSNQIVGGDLTFN